MVDKVKIDDTRELLLKMSKALFHAAYLSGAVVAGTMYDEKGYHIWMKDNGLEALLDD